MTQNVAVALRIDRSLRDTAFAEPDDLRVLRVRLLPHAMPRAPRCLNRSGGSSRVVRRIASRRNTLQVFATQRLRMPFAEVLQDLSQAIPHV